MHPELRTGIRRWPVVSSLAALVLLLMPAPADAAGPPCKPCAGVQIASPNDWLDALAAEPRLEDEARLYVAWPTAASAAGAAATHDVAATGATPWLQIRIATPAPVRENLASLDSELEGLAALARASHPSTHFEIRWPPGRESGAAEMAFLFKRAAVAITGARPDALVLPPALPAELDAIDTWYAEDVAAYLDGVVLLPAPDEALAAALQRLEEIDPGKPVVVSALPMPAAAARAIVAAARQAAAGVSATFFEAAAPSLDLLAPLKTLANEFRGEDLAYDPYSSPTDAWAFVRGEDLSLVVIVDRTGGAGSVELADSTLRRPMQVDPATGASGELFGLQRTAGGLAIPLEGDSPVAILRLARPDLADLVGESGLAEEVTITTARAMPVAEILRRLQANEDAQQRALEHYEAVNTTHLRFQGGTGVQTVEATFEGSFYAAHGEPYDWAWESFYVNGVKWRSKRIPEIPLVQPEKAATMPLEVNFDRDYDYRLRGTETIDGRDCWVVEFEPASADAAGNRFKGTVWIDRVEYLRVRTRALQIGLAGEVISNEETLYYTPLAADGSETSWEDAAFTLPLRVVSQQIFSVLNATVNVEKETLLTGVAVNRAGFAERRAATLASETTMVRDTDGGLRFLVPDEETGSRVVQEEFDKSRLFLVGGIFYDESFDFPLPLAGVNWFSFDFKGTGSQANLFFAGVIANATFSDPEFLGSRWDAGAESFVLGIPFTNTFYRDGVESVTEDVDVQRAEVGLTLGRPIGNFVKLSAQYELTSLRFDRADDTGEDFVIPDDHLLHSLQIGGRYARNGYRFSVGGSFHKRSEWRPWGLPGAPFDPDTDEFTLWNVRLAKNFHLKKFRRVGLEIEHLDGNNLDRFSKYNFGYFSDAQVHGYESGLVQADSASGFHASYGLEIGELFRLEVVGDAVWASDEASGLDNELLGGVGVAGTFIGPWQTVVNLDLGVPVAGPDDDGFTLFLAFLKLFK